MLFIQQHIINVLIISDPFIILCIPIGTVCIIPSITRFVNRFRLYSAIVIEISYNPHRNYTLCVFDKKAKERSSLSGFLVIFICHCAVSEFTSSSADSVLSASNGASGSGVC